MSCFCCRAFAAGAGHHLPERGAERHNCTDNHVSVRAGSMGCMAVLQRVTVRSYKRNWLPFKRRITAIDCQFCCNFYHFRFRSHDAAAPESAFAMSFSPANCTSRTPQHSMSFSPANCTSCTTQHPIARLNRCSKFRSMFVTTLRMSQRSARCCHPASRLSFTRI